MVRDFIVGRIVLRQHITSREKLQKCSQNYCRNMQKNAEKTDERISVEFRCIIF